MYILIIIWLKIFEDRYHHIQVNNWTDFSSNGLVFKKQILYSVSNLNKGRKNYPIYYVGTYTIKVNENQSIIC